MGSIMEDVCPTCGIRVTTGYAYGRFCSPLCEELWEGKENIGRIDYEPSEDDLYV